MKTSGYDLVLEFNRSFYEKILADVFHSSPEVASGGRAGLHYSLSLREPPAVEGFEGNRVKVAGAISIELALLGLRVELSPLLHIILALNIDTRKRKIVAEPMSSSLSSASGVAHRAFWFLTGALFGSRLLRHYEKITLPDTYAMVLPENPGEAQHPIDLEIAKIGSIGGSVIVICVNLLDRVGATPEWLVDFTEGQDVAFCIFEALSRVAKIF